MYGRYTIQMYSGITSGRVLDGELLYTKILEVNLFAFAYRLFHEDFSPIDRTLQCVWEIYLFLVKTEISTKFFFHVSTIDFPSLYHIFSTFIFIYIFIHIPVWIVCFGLSHGEKSQLLHSTSPFIKIVNMEWIRLYKKKWRLLSISRVDIVYYYMQGSITLSRSVQNWLKHRMIVTSFCVFSAVCFCISM